MNTLFYLLLFSPYCFIYNVFCYWNCSLCCFPCSCFICNCSMCNCFVYVFYGILLLAIIVLYVVFLAIVLCFTCYCLLGWLVHFAITVWFWWQQSYLKHLQLFVLIIPDLLSLWILVLQSVDSYRQRIIWICYGQHLQNFQVQDKVSSCNCCYILQYLIYLFLLNLLQGVHSK